MCMKKSTAQGKIKNVPHKCIGAIAKCHKMIALKKRKKKKKKRGASSIRKF